ncbi:hypothetical protein AKJ18_36065, partial [Vibrio xuii]
ALASLIKNCLEGQTLLLSQVEETNDSDSEDSMLIDPNIIQSDMAVLGKEKMQKIYELFDIGCDEILTQLETAAQNQDMNTTKQLAHKLKGSAGSLGLLSLFELCKGIEKDKDPITCYFDSQ